MCERATKRRERRKRSSTWKRMPTKPKITKAPPNNEGKRTRPPRIRRGWGRGGGTCKGNGKAAALVRVPVTRPVRGTGKSTLMHEMTGRAAVRELSRMRRLAFVGSSRRIVTRGFAKSRFETINQTRSKHPGQPRIFNFLQTWWRHAGRRTRARGRDRYRTRAVFARKLWKQHCISIFVLFIHTFFFLFVIYK